MTAIYFLFSLLSSCYIYLYIIVVSKINIQLDKIPPFEMRTLYSTQ